MTLPDSRILQRVNTLRKAMWANKERYALALTNLFNECESEDQIWMVRKLLEEFVFINSDIFVNEISKISNQIENVWSLAPKDTIILATCDSAKPDGSQSVVRALEVELPLRWRGKIYNNIYQAFASRTQNLILVDDFIGSGKTLDGKVARIFKHAIDKGSHPNIYLTGLAGMEVGINRLEVLLNNRVFIPIRMHKAISHNIADANDRKRAIDSMIELEQKLLPVTPYPKPKKLQEYNFGYNLSEAIYFQEGANVPNNVFPIFWKENINVEGKSVSRTSLFRRR